MLTVISSMKISSIKRGGSWVKETSITKPEQLHLPTIISTTGLGGTNTSTWYGCNQGELLIPWENNVPEPNLWALHSQCFSLSNQTCNPSKAPTWEERFLYWQIWNSFSIPPIQSGDAWRDIWHSWELTPSHHLCVLHLAVICPSIYAMVSLHKSVATVVWQQTSACHLCCRHGNQPRPSALPHPPTGDSSLWFIARCMLYRTSLFTLLGQAEVFDPKVQ